MQASVMKHFITYLLCLHTCSAAFGNFDFLKLFNGTTNNELGIIKFPDEKGTVHIFNSTAKPNSKWLFNIGKFTNKYYLYTRATLQYEELIMNDIGSIIYSNFNTSSPTAVIVHGWTGNRDSNINIALRGAFTMIGYNVIVLDWSKVADKDYITSVEGVPRVGRYLGKFLSFLTTVTNVSISSLHLVGHSLGAHVVGNAGKELGGQVGRITGLDPAGPLWSLNSKRLSETDALYVEALHTNAGFFGILETVARTDFYANGGFDQPGCLTDICSHERSWKVFASSLMFNNLVGYQCSSLLQFTLDMCYGASLNFGNDELMKSGSGVYRLKTKSDFPY
ncbi:PREDICTED: pancreatic triacylglycerol lipase-like [Papilio xuthus]|uniref:Pancreatic triacylglycerol lipase-like n=1 Tax=Papilio xuthus TaxID=66420 RepID=A0AAJ6ZCK1_PAPXU|nr:PREDICTED: pancreatic triacylglycerol lipase-like [Papilio xuthus]